MDAIVFFISEKHVKISISVTLDSMDDVIMNLYKWNDFGNGNGFT